MPTDVEVLAEMGFSENRAKRALAKTGYKGVPVAMEWLLAHSDDPDIDDPIPEPEGHKLTDTPADESSQPSGAEASSSETSAAASAKSLKCDECGKLLRTENDVHVHAARTGHSKFSESTEEIKPLTEEEKKAQLAQVQELLKKKRQEKEEKEKQEQIAREKARRTQGKELTSIKQKMEEDEMKKIMEQRRREKEEEKKAKQRVREQIEKDKRDRAQKFATGGEAGQQISVSGTTAVSTNQAQAAPAAATGPKEYKETRLQIRLPNGEALTQTFQAGEELSAVRLFVTMNRKDGDTAPFTFKTTFPAKTFSEEDMEAPLKSLGLVPSAVLMVSKLS